MKKAMIILMVIGSLAIPETSGAQNGPTREKESRKEMRSDFTPEQRAELLSKRMTLELDLTDLQQKKVKQLFLNSEKERPAPPKNRKDMTSEEKFAFKNNQMDRRIAMKKELKEILSPEQFEKWEKIRSEKHSRPRKDSKGFKGEER